MSIAEIRLPESLTSRRDQPQVAKIPDAEQALDDSKWCFTKERIHISHKPIAQLKKEILGLQARIAAEWKRRVLMAYERASVEALFAGKARFPALKREDARLKGSCNDRLSLVAKVRQYID